MTMPSFLPAFIALLLIASGAASATNAPEITPQFDDSKPVMDLSPLLFAVVDDDDPEPKLDSAELLDAEGSLVAGVAAEWGARCPEGFNPSDKEGVCERIDVVQKVPTCQDEFALVQNEMGADVCQLEQTVPAFAACSEGYTLSAEGNLCEKFETKPAAPICEPGWSIVGSECQRTVTEPSTVACPEGYNLSGGQCVMLIVKPAVEQCPQYSQEVGGECSTVVYSKANACPGGSVGSNYLGPNCQYPVGVKQSSTTPTKVVSCNLGQTKYQNTCRLGTNFQCSKHSVFTASKGLYDYTSVTSCGYTASSCPAGYSTKKYGLYGDSTFCYKNSYRYCPSGYFLTAYDGCLSNSSYPPKKVTYQCSSWGETLSYSGGKCWKTADTFEASCPSGYAVNSGEGLTADNYNVSTVCKSGSSQPKGTLCEAGYTFDGTDAVCASVTSRDAELQCDDGWHIENGECRRTLEEPGEMYCPDGFVENAEGCVKTHKTSALVCPVGYTDKGSYCQKTIRIDAGKTYQCPTGTIAQFCGYKMSFADLWRGNYGDESLPVSQQIEACDSYTTDSGYYKYFPVDENTLCAETNGISSGPGYHCTGSGTQYCKETTEVKHRTALGPGFSKIGASYSCPSGYTKNGEVCEKTEEIVKCGAGWTYNGGWCTTSTTLPLEIECPDGYFGADRTCYRHDAAPIEYVCSSDEKLRGNKCLQIVESGAYSGGGCPSGQVVTGGSCKKTDKRAVSPQCPSGFVLNSSNVCERVDSNELAYECGADTSWSLQATTCWRTLTEPSATECPDGSWVLAGTACERTTTDSVARVCPEGYLPAGTHHNECFRIDASESIQGNELKVTIPRVWPGSYTLELNVSDGAGNATQEQYDVLFQPQLIQQRNGLSNLTLPAVNHAFHWRDGADTFVTQTIAIEDEPLVGIRPIYAGVRRGAESALSINGVIVAPGEYKKVHDAYDFGIMESVLELPIYPLDTEKASSSDLIVSIGGNGELAAIISVDAWVFSGGIQKSRQSPTRIFDEILVSATTGTDTACSLEARSNQALSAGALENPLCLTEWMNIPAPLKASVSGDPVLRGTVDNEGELNFGFKAYLFDKDGTKIEVGSVDGQLQGASAMGAVDYDFDNDISTVYHTVQDIRMTLKQTDGPNCRLTVDEEYAKSFATRESRVKFCYLEWEHLPGTLTQEPQSLTPNARGRVFYTGEYQASFRVYAYTSIGTPVLVQQKTLQFEAIEPPPPKVTIVGGEPIVQNLYPVPTKGGKVLDVEINAENAAIRVSEFFNGGVIKKDEFPAVPWQVNFRNYQRIALDQTPLWTRSTHEVEALYTDLPNLRGSVSFDSLSVPGEEVRPVMSTDGNVALNDDKITLKIAIRDIYNQSEGYSPQTMGSWDVRVVQQESYDRNSPVTEWVSIDAEGNASLPLDLEALNMTSGILRLYAEAKVRSPVPEYSKTVTSSQPVTVTVLYGGQIDAELDARYISGEAPFRTVFSLELMDRNLFSALGDVEWYIQEGEQGDWEKVDNTNRNPRVFERTFDEGIYYVKAKLLNRNSEAQTETPPLKVISYHKPRLEVGGPAVVFVGDTVEMKAVASFDGDPLVPEDVVMQWSEDAGKTWKEGGFDYVLTRDAEEVGRVRLHTRARMPIAPAEDRNAWTENKGSVEFRTIRPPRTYIYGPRVAEVGKEHKYQVHLGLPYARMGYEVKGFFTMPDGTEVEGDTAFYTPSSEELAETYAFIKYTAYIVGWREKGAEQVRDQRIRLWEYDFPEFQMSERYSASVAPADATFYVRPVNFRGRLENPVYEWEFPESVEVIEDRNPIARKLQFAEPGNYPLTVTITDDRGNVAKVEKVISLGVPDPYNADFVISGDTRHIRDPYEILVRPVISGGHPRDYIVDRKYYLNGEPMGSYGSYGQAILGAGTSTIKMEITSKFGEKAVKEEKFTVNENQPPVCKLEHSDRLGSWLLRADCSDPDGNVKTHNWWVNGEKLSLSGYRISINDSGTEPVEIQLSAVDDSGEESSKKTVILERPAPEPNPEPEP